MKPWVAPAHGPVSFFENSLSTNNSLFIDGANDKGSFKLGYTRNEEKGIVPNSLSFVINDEVHINFGKEIVNNYFDQNRFFLGLKYQLNDQNNFQVGYMNLFQQLPAGNKYRSLHTMRLFYFQNLDLRRKNIPQK